MPAKERLQATSPRKCRAAEAEEGRIINADTKQPYTRSDPCVERGVTIHYNELATKKAHADVVAFLKQVFGM